MAASECAAEWCEVVSVELVGSVVVGLGGDGVEPGVVTGAGECDVAGFAVEAIGAEYEGFVPGGALCLVDGECVGVVEMPCVQIAAGKADVLVAAMRLDGDRLLLGVDGDDGPAGAVEDPGAVVVPATHDLVADSEAASGDLELLSGELTVSSERASGPLVEVIDV